MEEGKESDGGQVPGSMAPEPTSNKENNGDPSMKSSMKYDPLPVNSRLAFNHPERRLNNQMFRRIPCADVTYLKTAFFPLDWRFDRTSHDGDIRCTQFTPYGQFPRLL